MKLKLTLGICALFLALSSCIKDEPLNKETDILSFEVRDGSYIDTDIRNDVVNVYVTDDIDLTKVTPVIEATPGAIITPASGQVQDFSRGPVAYMVISEDGKYSKEYLVTFVKLSSLNLSFDFEFWKMTSQNYYDLEIRTDEGYYVKMWDSGNPGIAFVNQGKEFPTSFTTDSYSGRYAAKLQTMRGGVNIGNIKIPIFSGSLFYGSFSLKEGIAEPRKCLRLGRLHSEKYGKPLKFTGYYKYQVGSPYIYLDDNKNEISTTDIIDEFSIYAVLFRVTKGQSGTEFLDGITILDSDKIVARADWKKETAAQTDRAVEKGYTRFEIPFEYNGEELDYEKYDYKLTIMFASSKDGNEYKGSIGSTLIVDDVDIICEGDEDE